MTSSTQHSETSERFKRSVTCAWCGNRYRSACPDELDRGLQGSHCASDVVQEDGQWLVRGGYGSDEHDLHRYLFVANPPTAPADPVCDECISQRLQAGDLQDAGLEVDRRPSDFCPRPLETWSLVHQIRELVQDRGALQKLADAAVKTTDAGCLDLADAVSEYRKYQRWTGTLDDGGEEHAEGCEKMAAQMREAARQLEDLATLWERSPAAR